MLNKELDKVQIIKDNIVVATLSSNDFNCNPDYIIRGIFADGTFIDGKDSKDFE